MEILDQDIPDEKVSKYEKMLSVIVLLASGLIWWGLYKAGELPYDDNYGLLLTCLLWSVIICIGLVVVFLKWPSLIRRNWFAIIVYLITSSPVPLIIVFINYEGIFGVSLQN